MKRRQRPEQPRPLGGQDQEHGQGDRGGHPEDKDCRSPQALFRNGYFTWKMKRPPVYGGRQGDQGEYRPAGRDKVKNCRQGDGPGEKWNKEPDPAW